jgi:hypothetical protein
MIQACVTSLEVCVFQARAGSSSPKGIFTLGARDILSEPKSSTNQPLRLNGRQSLRGSAPGRTWKRTAAPETARLQALRCLPGVGSPSRWPSFRTYLSQPSLLRCQHRDAYRQSSEGRKRGLNRIPPPAAVSWIVMRQCRDSFPSRV